MSSNPFGDQGPNPYQPSQFAPGMGGGISPELIAKAGSANTMGICSIVFAFCCPLIGLILGIMAMNNAGSVISGTPAGSEPHAKASTAKMLAIIGLVLSAINMVAGVAINVMNR